MKYTDYNPLEKIAEIKKQSDAENKITENKIDIFYGKVLYVQAIEQNLVIEHESRGRLLVSSKWCSNDPDKYLGQYYYFSEKDIIRGFGK